MEKTKEILTKTQELRHLNETLNALKILVTTQEIKNLIEDIELGKIESRFDYYVLRLTKDGLMETTAVTDYGKFIFNTEVVKPSVELIKRYNLTAEALIKLLANLKV